MVSRASESFVPATRNLFDSNRQEIVAPYLHTSMHLSFRFVTMSGVFSFIADPWFRKWKGRTTRVSQNATTRKLHTAEYLAHPRSIPNHFHFCGSSKKYITTNLIWLYDERMPRCVGVCDCWVLIHPDFFFMGIEHVMYRWEECLSWCCDYEEKQRNCPSLLVVLIVRVYIELISMCLTHFWCHLLNIICNTTL
jgi:hypothetical protein